MPYDKSTEKRAFSKQKRPPGRPRKYESDKDRKLARKLSQKKYRESKNDKKQHTLWLTQHYCDDLLGEKQSERCDELLKIVYDYKSVMNHVDPDGKKITQDRAEKELLQAINFFIDSDKKTMVQADDSRTPAQLIQHIIDRENLKYGVVFRQDMKQQSLDRWVSLFSTYEDAQIFKYNLSDNWIASKSRLYIEPIEHGRRTFAEGYPATDPENYAQELLYNVEKHPWGWRKAFEKYLQMEDYAEIDEQKLG